MINIHLPLQITYIRCIFAGWCPSSLDEISRLVSICNLIKVTLIYLEKDDKLKGDELEKVRKIADNRDVKLDVLCSESLVMKF